MHFGKLLEEIHAVCRQGAVFLLEASPVRFPMVGAREESDPPVVFLSKYLYFSTFCNSESR